LSARRAEALPRVFDSFLRLLAEQEDEAWERAQGAAQGAAAHARAVVTGNNAQSAQQGAAAYARAVEQLVAELCPSNQEGPADDVFGPFDGLKLVQTLEAEVTQNL
jgi:hypothetical protein